MRSGVAQRRDETEKASLFQSSLRDGRLLLWQLPGLERPG